MEISSQKNVLNVVLLILLKSTSRLSWNRRVTVCYEDSGRYMAKAWVCRLMPSVLVRHWWLRWIRWKSNLTDGIELWRYKLSRLITLILCQRCGPDIGVSSGVEVARRRLSNDVTWRPVFRDASGVVGVVELWRIVVDVYHNHRHCRRASQCRETWPQNNNCKRWQSK